MADQKKTRTRAPVDSGPGSAHGGRGRRSSGRAGKSRISWAVLIWIGFFIFICGLFLYSREAIITSVQTIQNELSIRNLPVEPPPEEINGLVSQPIETPPPVPIPLQPPPVQEPVIVPPVIQEEAPPQVAVGSQPVQTPETVPSLPPEQGRVELRERALYFTQVDRGGSILRVKVDRNMPLSSSPMTDVVHALIAGPTEDERQQGLICLIPPGTRMLSASVRGSTAYINFSEEFQFNTFGVEGYAGQLRQIVFTVTEFPNVRDVQILIEGRRVDFLGEGIWIGSPLSRDMF